jgi:hypothetical protein
LRNRHKGEDVALKARFEYAQEDLKLGCGSVNFPL